MFTATVEGAEELASLWVQVRAAIRAGVRRGVSQGVTEGAAEARSRHVFTNRTGALERSIQGRLTGNRTSVGASRDDRSRFRASGPGQDVGGETQLEPNDGAQYGEMVADAKNKEGVSYASYVEDGTKGGKVIVPKKPGIRFLRWFNPIGSTSAVFAKRVVRGATKPHTFMSFAFLKCERVMIREIERGVAQAQAILDR